MSAEKSRKDAAHAQLFAAILELRNVQECHDFFEDLCTIAERKAMSARLEVARMLKNGDSYEDVVKKTGVSTATISRINRCLQHGAGGYTVILERMEQAGRMRQCKHDEDV